MLLVQSYMSLKYLHQPWGNEKTQSYLSVKIKEHVALTSVLSRKLPKGASSGHLVNNVSDCGTQLRWNAQLGSNPC